MWFSIMVHVRSGAASLRRRERVDRLLFPIWRTKYVVVEVAAQDSEEDIQVPLGSHVTEEEMQELMKKAAEETAHAMTSIFDQRMEKTSQRFETCINDLREQIRTMEKDIAALTEENTCFKTILAESQPSAPAKETGPKTYSSSLEPVHEVEHDDDEDGEEDQDLSDTVVWSRDLLCPVCDTPCQCDQHLPESCSGIDDMDSLSPGTYVLLQNLVARPEMNGQIGVTVEFDTAARRWQVRLLLTGKVVLLKDTNLQRISSGCEDAFSDSGSE